MPEEVDQSGSEHAASKALEAEGKADAAEAKSFSADYVKALRDEAAGWRVQAQQYKQPWEGVTDDDREVWAEMIRLTKEDPKKGAAYMETIAKYLNGEPEATTTPPAGLSERDVAKLVDDRVNAANQQAVIREINQQAESLGYEVGTQDYVDLLWVAEHETNTDLDKAHKALQERRSAWVDAEIERRRENSGWPAVHRGGSQPAPSEKPVKTFQEARASLEERLNRI